MLLTKRIVRPHDFHPFFIKLGLLGTCCAIFFIAPSTQAFDETTTGKAEEDATIFGGLSSSDIDFLQKNEQETLKRLELFRKGRESSAKNPGSRYSGIEFHDLDFDIITDHENPGGGNDMEGGQDLAAGISRLTGDARVKALDKGIGTSGNCVEKNGLFVIKGSDVRCKNISANLIDKGSAHGAGANDPHRVYELSDASEKEALKKNTAYVSTLFRDAAFYDVKKYGLENVKAVGPDGAQVQVVEANGKSTTVNVGSDFDKLRSEASWLEQQKLATIDKNWKSLRAARLASSDGGSPDPANLGMSSLIWNNASDTEVAELIVAGQAVANAFYVKDGKTVGKDAAEKDCQLRPPPASLEDCMKENGYTMLSSALNDKSLSNTQKKSLLDEAKTAALNYQASGQTPDPSIKNAQETLKNSDKDIAMYKTCMEASNWCVNRTKMDAIARQHFKLDPSVTLTAQHLNTIVEDYNENELRTLYRLRPGIDPGLAYDDTREFNLSKLSIASLGPLADFEKNMKSMDLSEASDANTKSKQWAKLKEQIDYARNSAAQLQKEQRDLQKKFPGFKSKYLGSNFDEKTQTTYQLFMRQKGRDAETLGWGPQANELQNGRQQPINAGPEPGRQPSSKPTKAKAKIDPKWNTRSPIFD